MPKYSEIFLTCMLAFFTCSWSHAATFSSGSGLSGALLLDTDFSDAIASVGVDKPPGDFYSNVSFNEFLLGPSVFGGTGIRSLISGNPSIASAIVMAKPVNGVAFLVRAAAPLRITAFLNSQEIGSVSTNGDGYDVPTYYGFGEFTLDKIVLSFDSVPSELAERFIGIDHLQLGAIVSPNSVQVPQVWIANFLLGLLVSFRAIKTLHNQREQYARYACPTPNRSLFCKCFAFYLQNSSLSGAVVAERYVS